MMGQGWKGRRNQSKLELNDKCAWITVVKQTILTTGSIVVDINNTVVIVSSARNIFLMSYRTWCF